MKDPKPGDLVVCETRVSTWHYHLRVIGPEGFKPGGGDITALCGKSMGWDTVVPLASYGKSDHIPSHWCEKCQDEAKQKGLL
jgi:hypothetical protein